MAPTLSFRRGDKQSSAPFPPSPGAPISPTSPSKVFFASPLPKPTRSTDEDASPEGFLSNRLRKSSRPSISSQGSGKQKDSMGIEAELFDSYYTGGASDEFGRKRGSTKPASMDISRGGPKTSAPSTPTRPRFLSTPQTPGRDVQLPPASPSRATVDLPLPSPIPRPRPRGSSLAVEDKERRHAGWFTMNGPSPGRRTSDIPGTPQMDETVAEEDEPIDGEDEHREGRFEGFLRRVSRSSSVSAQGAPVVGSVISGPLASETRKASKEEIMHDLFLLNGGKAAGALGWAVQEDSPSRRPSEEDDPFSRKSSGATLATGVSTPNTAVETPSTPGFGKRPTTPISRKFSDADENPDHSFVYATPLSPAARPGRSTPSPSPRHRTQPVPSPSYNTAKHSRLLSDVTGIAMLGDGDQQEVLTVPYEMGPPLDPDLSSKTWPSRKNSNTRSSVPDLYEPMSPRSGHLTHRRSSDKFQFYGRPQIDPLRSDLTPKGPDSSSSENDMPPFVLTLADRADIRALGFANNSGNTTEDSSMVEEDTAELDVEIVNARRESLKRRASASRSHSTERSSEESLRPARTVTPFPREVICRVERKESDDGEEIRWEIVMRPRKATDGPAGSQATLGHSVQLAGEETCSNAPNSATSINLSLSLEQPTGKLVYVSLPSGFLQTPIPARKPSLGHSKLRPDFGNGPSSPSAYTASRAIYNGSPRRPTFPIYNPSSAMKGHSPTPLSPKSPSGSNFEGTRTPPRAGSLPISAALLSSPIGSKLTSTTYSPPPSPKDVMRARRKVSLQGGVLFSPTQVVREGEAL